MTTMSATQARKQWFELLQQASKPGLHVTIRHKNLPDTVIMSAEEFEGWMETMDIMSNPQEVADIKEGMADTETFTLEEVAKDLGLDV